MCEGHLEHANFASEGGFAEVVIVQQLISGSRRKRLDIQMIGPEDGGKIRLADIMLNCRCLQTCCVLGQFGRQCKCPIQQGINVCSNVRHHLLSLVMFSIGNKNVPQDYWR